MLRGATMLDQLDALRALADSGTMARAAVRLRVTQSAVSKRIAALEAEIGQALVEREGRRVRLTATGRRLLVDVAPVAAELRERLAAVGSATRGTVRLAATESLLGSWLPDCLRAVGALFPDTRLELHAHRGPWVVQRLRAAEVDLAVCVGSGEDGLALRELGDEPLVLVAPPGAPPPAPGDTVAVVTIESASHTGAWLGRRLQRLSQGLGYTLEPTLRIESFSTAVALARAGFGHALVPMGIALAMGAPESSLRRLPGAGRPIALYTRAGGAPRAVVARFADALEEQARTRLRGWRLRKGTVKAPG